MTLPLFDGVPAEATTSVRRSGTTTQYLYPNRHGSSYTVTVTDHGIRQMAIRCDCRAFKFSRWHECWHVKDVAEKQQLFTVIGGCLVNYPGDGLSR